VLTHCRHVFQAFSSCLVLAVELFQNTRRFVSSAKPTILTSGWSSFRALYSEAIYRMKRTGDSGEPCGTPAATRISSICWPSKWRIATLLLSHTCTHSTIHRRKPYCRIVDSSRVWLIVLKAPEISSCRREAAAFCLQVGLYNSLFVTLPID
jgi:hypothetical protein